MGIEPDISGVSRLEIDERSIIGNASIVLWMFCIIYHVSKNARVLCVMNDRHKEKLLPYVKNNIYTPGIEDNKEFATRIYSYCFLPIEKKTLLTWDMFCTG